MRKISTISSLLVIGALGIIATSWLNLGNIKLDLSDEETYLYL